MLTLSRRRASLAAVASIAAGALVVAPGGQAIADPLFSLGSFPIIADVTEMTIPEAVAYSSSSVGFGVTGAVSYALLRWGMGDNPAAILENTWAGLTGGSVDPSAPDPEPVYSEAAHGALAAYFTPSTGTQCQSTILSVGGSGAGWNTPSALPFTWEASKVSGGVVDCGEGGASHYVYGNWVSYGHATADAAGGYVAGHYYQTGSGTLSGTCMKTHSCNSFDAVTTANYALGDAAPTGPKFVVDAIRFYGGTTQMMPDRQIFVRPGSEVEGDPSGFMAQFVTLSNTRTCKDISTGTVSTVTGTSTTGSNNLVAPPDCPAGTYPYSQKIEATNSLTGQTVNLGTATLTADAATKYAECVTSGAGCTLSVWVDGVKCSYGVDECDTWWLRSESDPARVQCRWGIYTVAADNCAALRYAFYTPYGAVSDPTRPPRNAPVPAVSPQGDPWPQNEPLPFPEPNPEPSSSSSPTAGVPGFPMNGQNPAPGSNSVPSPGPNPGDDPENCWAAMWTWNPLDWVFTPVKCALVWGFVPRDSVFNQRGEEIRDNVWPNSVAAWTVPFAALPDAFSTGATDCMGPAVTLPDPFNMTFYPANACNPPMSIVASVMKYGLSALIVVALIVRAVNSIGSSLGYASSMPEPKDK